jgi:hypothetical protein
VIKNAHGDFDNKSTTIFAINSGISSLADVLNLLDSHFSINTLARSPCAKFISGLRCLLCRREKPSLSRVLGCVRSHFEIRPFQCTGCRLCNAANGYVPQEDTSLHTSYFTKYLTLSVSPDFIHLNS